LAVADGEWTYTTSVECSSTSSNVSGQHIYEGEKNTFTDEELLDLVLGDAQNYDADIKYPMPSDVYIHPEIANKDYPSLSVSSTSDKPDKFLFFTIKAKNFVDQYILCTIKTVGVRG
jgi:hypothetical protein